MYQFQLKSPKVKGNHWEEGNNNNPSPNLIPSNIMILKAGLTLSSELGRRYALASCRSLLCPGGRILSPCPSNRAKRDQNRPRLNHSTFLPENWWNSCKDFSKWCRLSPHWPPIPRLQILWPIRWPTYPNIWEGESLRFQSLARNVAVRVSQIERVGNPSRLTTQSKSREKINQIRDRSTTQLVR